MLLLLVLLLLLVVLLDGGVLISIISSVQIPVFDREGKTRGREGGMEVMEGHIALNNKPELESQLVLPSALLVCRLVGCILF